MNPNGFDTHLGALIQSFRIEMGLSPDDLASRLNQPRQWVIELERGAVRIGSAHVKALARAMNLGLADFFEPSEPVASMA